MPRLAALALIAGIALPALGQAPSALPVQVTGDPAPPAAISHGAALAAQALFRVPALRVDASWPGLGPLGPGRSIHVGLVLGLDETGGAPRAIGIPADVSNIALPWEDASIVALSNAPEDVRRPGTLWAGPLRHDGLRLLYHHLNASPRPLSFLVSIENTSASADRLWVSWDSAEARSPLDAGHRAAAGFLGQYLRHAGAVVDVPPGVSVTVDVLRAPPGGVASGIAQARLIEGDEAWMVVSAGAPGGDAWSARQDGAPAGAALRPATVTRMAQYTVGGRHIFLPIGDGPRPYGVLYAYLLRVANPFERPASVPVVAHADAGPARIAVAIGGAAIDTPALRPHDPVEIGRIPLAARATREVTVDALPEGGSNYPVLLEVGGPTLPY
jgi:hypothetical protein